MAAHNNGYKQKACHNFCIAPGQFHHDTKLISRLPDSQIRLWTISGTGTGFYFAGIAKIAPWCLASRDKLLAKVPGPVTGWTAPPTLSAHTRNR
jgi:hypothetical protein